MLEGQALEDALLGLRVEEAQGVAFRVIPAQYHVTALSGIGSLKRGGRFNPKGLLEALYLSESPITALQEVEAIMQTSAKLMGLKVGPKTLLSVEYSLQKLLDLTDSNIQAALQTSTEELTAPWLLKQTGASFAPTQQLGLAVAASGVEALMSSSSKNPDAANLVIYPHNLLQGSSLRVFDESGFIDATLP